MGPPCATQSQWPHNGSGKANTVKIVEAMIVAFLQGMVAKAPWLVGIFSVMGVCRMVLKPLFVFLHTAAEKFEFVGQ